MLALLGPVCAGVALLAGRVFGASLGMVGGSIALTVCAVLLWIGVARWRDGSTGGAAAFAWMFAGLLNVNAGNSLALLASGEHVLGAHVADVDSWRRHERVTFADGQSRSDLVEVAGHFEMSHSSTSGYRGKHFESCEAMPLVPIGWQRSSPVKVWVIDQDRGVTGPISEKTFETVTKPDDDCARAIEDVIAKHRVVGDADPIYLKLVITSTDSTTVKLGGIVAAALAALVWLGVLAWRWAGFQLFLRRKAREKNAR